MLKLAIFTTKWFFPLLNHINTSNKSCRQLRNVWPYVEKWRLELEIYQNEQNQIICLNFTPLLLSLYPLSPYVLVFISKVLFHKWEILTICVRNKVQWMIYPIGNLAIMSEVHPICKYFGDGLLVCFFYF